MPSSGARSGTKPSRSERGAGDGRIATGIEIECGHTVAPDATPIAAKPGRRMFRCPEGCGLQWEGRSERT